MKYCEHCGNLLDDQPKEKKYDLSNISRRLEETFRNNFNCKQMTIEMLAIFSLCLMILFFTYKRFICLNDYVKISCRGYNTYGRLIVELDYEKLLLLPHIEDMLPTLVIKYENVLDGALENGDSVKWRIEYDETVNKNDVKYISTEDTYIISGLLELD